MKVLKFGGSSIRDAEWMDRAIDIAAGGISEAQVIVVSAMADTTDRLQSMAEDGGQCRLADAIDRWDQLRSYHLNVAEKLIRGELRADCTEKLEVLFTELRSIIRGLSLVGERTERSNDLILSFGERLSSLVISFGARDRGIETNLVDARQIIRTDDRFSAANPIEDMTYSLIRKNVVPRPKKLIVTQGFIASNVDGITTTLGRNRSDYSAILLGAALHADEVQIWTDVDGIMTADPRIVPTATTIPAISYQEAAELAYFGAKVIHPSAIQPAVKISMPICVRNTGNTGTPGTRIVPHSPSVGPKAVAAKAGITVISITSGRMLMAYGFLRALFEVFEKHQTAVDIIATSEVSVSVTIDDPSAIDSIVRDLKKLGTVKAERKKAIVCLVGQGLWRSSDIIARVFSNLKRIPIRMISLGSSDTNLSLVVPENKSQETLKSLHREFFES